MESTPDFSDPPDHPSSSVGLTINSGSDGSHTPYRSLWERSESRESSPGPLRIERNSDVQDYRGQEAIRAANDIADQANAVSHPFPHSSSLNQGNSASDNGDGEKMTDEEFFALFGDEVPDRVKLPPGAELQAQDNGLQDLHDEDLEAQIDSELGPGGGDESMDIPLEDLEAQLNFELAGGDDDPMELCEEDLEAQLNAEIEAEASQQEAAKAARRKADLEEAARVAAEEAELEALCHQGDNASFPSDAADGSPGNTNNAFTVMSELGPNVNTLAVKRYLKLKSMNRPKKRARKTAPKPGPPEARVGSSQPPPMRKPNELPQMYHHGEINWNLLRKHMTLNTRVDLAHCYRTLGLDKDRGKALYDKLREYLRTPGNSVNLSAKDVDSEDAKRIIANIAHKLLVDQCWGLKYFDRPSLASNCKYITFEGNSTEVFLEFTSLVYKAMKLAEKRKKDMAKQQEDKTAREIVQHPTSEAFATSTYFSPQAVAQVLPSQAPTSAMGNSSEVIMLQQQSLQASTNAAANSQPVVPQQPPSQPPPNNAANNHPRVVAKQPPSRAPTNPAYNTPRATMQQPQSQPPADAQNNVPHLGVEQHQSQPRNNTQSDLPHAVIHQQQTPAHASSHPVPGVMQQSPTQVSTSDASNPPPRPDTQRQPPIQPYIGPPIVAPRSVPPVPRAQSATGGPVVAPRSVPPPPSAQATVGGMVMAPHSVAPASAAAHPPLSAATNPQQRPMSS